MNRSEMILDLQIGPCKVNFTKVNGDTREMTCTLDSTLIPSEHGPKNEKTDKRTDSVLAVYDIIAGGWRSFRIANVTEFAICTAI